jgi:indole-3-glycerol phosphate synthase
MLERFRAAKAAEIESLKTRAAKGEMPAPFAGVRPGFAAALRAAGAGGIPAAIAEYKRASPSKGVINLGLEPEEAARRYAAAGAAALSVLTEEVYFQGSLGFLGRMTGPGLPLLRKDFLFDHVQVAATAATPASAMLLIVRMLPGGLLAEMLTAARGYGLEAVVEVFDEPDLVRAKAAGAAIIQVNNRDLDTLAVDRSTSLALAPAKEAGEVWISASGISEPGHVTELAAAGFDAVLVGTALMAEADPGAALARLLGKRP